LEIKAIIVRNIRYFFRKSSKIVFMSYTLAKYHTLLKLIILIINHFSDYVV